jgi:hypothetical protein
MDYVRNFICLPLSPDDADEDQLVEPEDLLRYECKDELALDEWVYDGHSIDDTPDYDHILSPLKDMCVYYFVNIPSILIYLSMMQFGPLAWLFLRRRGHPGDHRI